MSTLRLEPAPITDNGVLDQCKKALNKWSNSLPFSVTRNLGDAVQLVSANMYHAYSFSVGTDFVKRKFDLQKGGKPGNTPTSIDRFTLWNVPGVKDMGNFDFAIKETCHKETCAHCHGKGELTCEGCRGTGKVVCPSCDGKGRHDCKKCHGKGVLRCDRCYGGGPIDSMIEPSGIFFAGKGYVFDNNKNKIRCPKCHGSARRECDVCHGERLVKCSKCGGNGKIKCGKCSGSGVVVCDECDGRGWNSFTWHLIQEQGKDELRIMFYDTGIAEKHEVKKYKKCTTTSLLSEKKNAGQVSMSGIGTDCADFATELHEKWKETYAKFSGVEDTHVLTQQVDFIQYDVLIRYEYKYNDKVYLVWIDLANKKVFEGAEGGMMAEWSGNVAKDGDKFAGKDPQRAIRCYAMACAISKDNQEPAKKIRSQLALGSWLFRLATAGLGGWLWSVFLKAQGADSVVGWYIAAALVVLDLLFARKGLWMSFVAAAGVYGFIVYLFPELMPPDIATKVGSVKRLLPIEITGNALLREYMVYSVLLWMGGTLLFARDLALRIRGGVLVFPVLGALVGAACAPTGYLDFAKDPSRFLLILRYVTYGVCGLAIARTLSRAFVQNCGRNAQKFPNFLIRLEAKTLKPTFWLMPVYVAVFAGVGAFWYSHAGPGVGIEEKAEAARRFLQDERSGQRGRYYLELTANSGYVPSISLLAELKLFGKCGYAVDLEEGYAMAAKAAGMNDPRGCRLQGSCLESGRGVAQNLTEANACYAKGESLGDTESAQAKSRTDAIAKVWNPAYANDASAQYKLAMHYLKGDGIAKDDATARKWMSKSADAGFVKAQMTVCDWLIKGVGGEKNPELGVNYCEKAAQQNDPEAIAVLGYYYFEGKVVKRNYRKAIDGFLRACEKGSESAPYMLGFCSREGLGVQKDPKKAFEYFKLAGDRGSLPGTFACGECYETAYGVDVDYSAALACYVKASEKEWEAPLLKKSVADAKIAASRIAKIGRYWKLAKDGDAIAMDNVGQCFAAGDDVKKDDVKAYEWFAQAAAKDNVDGIVHKADALYNGVGVKQDVAAAGKEYVRAAAKGHTYALYMQGRCHEHGYGVERNLTSAYACYSDAAKKGNKDAGDAAKRIAVPAKYWDAAFKRKDAKAQYGLALCYKRGGCGVDQNDVEAFTLFRMAADQGDAMALFEVSKCYAKGVGTHRDDAEMKKAVMASADKDYAPALFFAGELHQVGRAVERNVTTAYNYFCKAAAAKFPEAEARAKMIAHIAKYWDAAARGDADAQYNLGVCYRDGVEIAKDISCAKAWFQKAESQGHHDAEYALAALYVAEANGDGTAIAQNAVPLLKRASAANQVDARVLLGKLLYRGIGIDEDYEQAVKLWDEAAAVDNLEAKYCLGDYYYTGRGLFNSGKDQDKAMKMWKEASAAGNFSASRRLGEIYAKGSGLFAGGKDRGKARKYLKRAIDKGDRASMRILGEMLEDSGSLSDKKEGAEWRRRAKEDAGDSNPDLKWYSAMKTLD